MIEDGDEKASRLRKEVSGPGARFMGAIAVEVSAGLGNKTLVNSYIPFSGPAFSQEDQDLTRRTCPSDRTGSRNGDFREWRQSRQRKTNRDLSEIDLDG